MKKRTSAGKRSAGKTAAIALALVAAGALLVPAFYSGLMVTPYSLAFPMLPPAFDGFTIVQISDLHSYLYGRNQNGLVETIAAQQPDLIVLTGDIINRHDKNLAAVEPLLRQITTLAPGCAIGGNHEFDNPALFAQLRQMYKSYGIEYLDGAAYRITRGGQSISVAGGSVASNELGHTWVKPGKPDKQSDFNILLHHFGDQFDEISISGYNLVIAGHTHGGLIRLPGVGGLFSNDYKMFPKYTKGVYQQADATMVLSAGLGGSLLPRVYNRRELVVITLHHVA